MFFNECVCVYTYEFVSVYATLPFKIAQGLCSLAEIIWCFLKKGVELFKKCPSAVNGQVYSFSSPIETLILVFCIANAVALFCFAMAPLTDVHKRAFS